MPISRRCASTVRLMRLKAAKVAAEQEREDVEHLLVALGVLVDQPVRGLLIAAGDREARARQRLVQCTRELLAHAQWGRRPGAGA